MNTLCHGEIYLIRFSPSVGHEYQKIRPGIIMSSDEMLKRSSLFTCIALTSKVGNFVEEDDIFLKKDSENKLSSDSAIKMQHVCTFDKSRIHKYIGKIDLHTLGIIKEKLKLQFNL